MAAVLLEVRSCAPAERRAVLRGAPSAASEADSVIVHRCLAFGCQRIIAPSLSYCGEHRPKRDMTARGGGATQRTFRTEVLYRADHRCEVLTDGRRCPETVALEAHHVVAISDGGSNDPANGRAVCPAHHRAITAAQRRAARKC